MQNNNFEGSILEYKNIFDSHVHSINSFDGHHSCYDLCRGAITNGGIGIAITDHCDIDGDDYDVEKQFSDAQNAKDEFDGKLTVLRGIELGQGIFRKSEAEKILDTHNYDIVIGSIHNLENMEDFYFLDYKNVDIHALLLDYFTALLELAQWDKCDTLAHLTYPLRYIYERERIKVDLSKYYDIIDAVFDTLIKNHKALELNVSGLFMDINETLPGIDLIKRFHDMGGKYVTVGTDSHYREKVCIGIDKGYDILLRCGYDKFTVFHNRIPTLIAIK